MVKIASQESAYCARCSVYNKLDPTGACNPPSTSTTLLASLSMPTTSIALCLNRKAFRPLAESPRAGPDRFRLQAKVRKNLAHANSLELQKSECWHCGNQFKFLSCSVAGADRSLDKWQARWRPMVVILIWHQEDNGTVFRTNDCFAWDSLLPVVLCVCSIYASMSMALHAENWDLWMWELCKSWRSSSMQGPACKVPVENWDSVWEV